MRDADPPAIDRTELLNSFSAHPFSEDNLLRRLSESRRSLDGLDAMDLAVDDVGQLTDQNHVGGVQFVAELAEAAGIDAASYVLDLGCGLGGSARVLAHMFGCRVDGTDLSHTRIAQARRLTQLVGLSRLVHCEAGDFLSAPVPSERYDMIWGQGAWLHVAQRAAFIGRWTPALRSRGRIAFEHACLLRRPRTDAETAELGDLMTCWHAAIAPPEEWEDAFRSSGLRMLERRDLTTQFIDYYGELADLADSQMRGLVPAEELDGWRLARDCADAGVVGYVRLIAERPG